MEPSAPSRGSLRQPGDVETRSLSLDHCWPAPWVISFLFSRRRGDRGPCHRAHLQKLETTSCGSPLRRRSGRRSGTIPEATSSTVGIPRRARFQPVHHKTIFHGHWPSNSAVTHPSLQPSLSRQLQPSIFGGPTSLTSLLVGTRRMTQLVGGHRFSPSTARPDRTCGAGWHGIHFAPRHRVSPAARASQDSPVLVCGGCLGLTERDVHASMCDNNTKRVTESSPAALPVRPPSRVWSPRTAQICLGISAAQPLYGLVRVLRLLNMTCAPPEKSHLADLDVPSPGGFGGRDSDLGSRPAWHGFGAGPVPPHAPPKSLSCEETRRRTARRLEVGTTRLGSHQFSPIFCSSNIPRLAILGCGVSRTGADGA